MGTARSILAAALLAGASAFPGMAQDRVADSQPDGDWRTINRDLAATRYSPLDQIDASNVANLQPAWTYTLRAFNTAVPVVVNGTMFVTAQSRVVALDAATGQERWVRNAPPAPEGAAGPPGGYSGRGVGYWPGEGDMAARILVMRGNMMEALDAATGEPVAGFGNNGSLDVGVPYGGAVTVAGNVAIIGAASLENPEGPAGNPRAFDVRNGARLWEFDTTPAPGQLGGDTWGSGWENRGGTNMWGFMATVDADEGVAYLPIAGPAHNYFGGDRPGDNLFGNSVVAVDLRTGEYKWHFQTVHHDLWDIDMSHAGPLIPLGRSGNRRGKALANVGKSSLFYVLDAETGEPVHAVAEEPVPQGSVPGEYYSPTQPIPQVTPPLSRVSMTWDDIVTAEDTNPEHAAACVAMWDKAGGYENHGMFTPFGLHQEGEPPRSTIQLPGGIGGVNWGGPTADPTTGMVYVNAIDTSLVGWVERVKGGEPYSFDYSEGGSFPAYDRASVDGKGPFFSFAAPLSGEYDDNGRPVGVSAPCYKPPWARLTAIDANTGEVKWAVPLGMFEELPEGRQVLGNAGSAGPTVTAGGLVFVGATNDKRFRAFDASNGRQLWEAVLNGNANANPMTYTGGNGKQYVAINASGVITTYALP